MTIKLLCRGIFGKRPHLSFTTDMQTEQSTILFAQIHSHRTQSESHNTATAHAYMYFTPIHTFLTANELSSITIQFNIQLLINTSKYNRRAQVPCSPSPPSSAISFSSSKRQRCLQLITNSSRSKTEPTNAQIPSPSSHQVVLRTTT